MSALAVTWWGHASTTVETGGVRIATDPVLPRRLAHLRRHAPLPTPDAVDVDVVLVSHLHGDHLHLPSLASAPADAVVVVPEGGQRILRPLAGRDVRFVRPGDRLDVAGLGIEVLPARHDGRRTKVSRESALAQGFRVDDGEHSLWYPGDTGLFDAMADVEPVDLALVPIGGWGPTLGDEHLDPDQAAAAVDLVGARWALPVHYGTFWPVGMRTLNRANHQRLFVTPPARFADAMHDRVAEAVVPAHGERVELVAG